MNVPHRQWVFNMPKRLRILFRLDHRLLGTLCREKKITQEVVDSMCQWSHSGFSIDNSVCIETDDQVGLQRLTEYIVRCPFSLARMVKITDDGKMIYRTGKSNCLRFPEHGDEQFKAGTSRNFQVFELLEFLAEITQHIPEKGQHFSSCALSYENAIG